LIYSRYFEGFTLDNKTALSLIDAKCYLHLLENFEDFQGLDYNYIANKLIEVGEGKILLSYLRKFQGLDYNDIACRLIDLGHANSVLEYIENILDIDSVKIVTKLIDAGKLEEIVKKLGIFSNLNLEIAIKIIETDGLHKILQNIQSFNENDRLEILKKTSEIRPSLLNFYFTKYEEHLIPEQETEILAKIENAKNQ
ncbi:MAG: hypothetical protein ACPGTS_00665, partial [Minisyncoccia bacterium]